MFRHSEQSDTDICAQSNFVLRTSKEPKKKTFVILFILTWINLNNMFRWTLLIHSIAWLSIDFLGNARNVLGEIHMKKMLLREIAWKFRLIDLLECWTLISKLDSMYIFIIKYKNIYTYVVCVLYRPYHKNMTQRHDLSAKSRLSKRAYYFIISHIVLFHFTARHLAFICIYILVIYMCVYCSYVCLYLSHMNCTTNDDYYFFFLFLSLLWSFIWGTTASEQGRWPIWSGPYFYASQ